MWIRVLTTFLSDEEVKEEESTNAHEDESIRTPSNILFFIIYCEFLHKVDGFGFSFCSRKGDVHFCSKVFLYGTFCDSLPGHEDYLSIREILKCEVFTRRPIFNYFISFIVITFIREAYPVNIEVTSCIREDISTLIIKRKIIYNLFPDDTSIFILNNLFSNLLKWFICLISKNNLSFRLNMSISSILERDMKCYIKIGTTSSSEIFIRSLFFRCRKEGRKIIKTSSIKWT
jgi:hypothetical protein